MRKCKSKNNEHIWSFSEYNGQTDNKQYCQKCWDKLPCNKEKKVEKSKEPEEVVDTSIGSWRDDPTLLD